LNQLFIEEEDYEALRKSIDSHDNFDNIALAQKVENLDLLEFRRIAAYLYKRNKRWQPSIQLSKNDKLFKDAIDTASESGDPSLAENLLLYFVENKMPECFAAALYSCYDLIHPDVALEYSWRYNILDYGVPYLVQVLREYIPKIDKLEKKNKEAEEKAKVEIKEQPLPGGDFNPSVVPMLPGTVPGSFSPTGFLPPGSIPPQFGGQPPFVPGVFPPQQFPPQQFPPQQFPPQQFPPQQFPPQQFPPQQFPPQQFPPKYGSAPKQQKDSFPGFNK